MQSFQEVFDRLCELEKKDEQREYVYSRPSLGTSIDRLARTHGSIAASLSEIHYSCCIQGECTSGRRTTEGHVIPSHSSPLTTQSEWRYGGGTREVSTAGPLVSFHPLADDRTSAVFERFIWAVLLRSLAISHWVPAPPQQSGDSAQ